MATISGFQANSTIHAAFWIYKPDPVIDPVSKQEFIEVNTLQRVEANAEIILATLSATSLTNNVLTVTVNATGHMRSQQQVIFRGLTNSPFLNGEVVTILSVTPTTFSATFTNQDYATTAEPVGAVVLDTTNRTAYLYYPESGVSTSQSPRKLVGAVASVFLYNMEELFY